MWNTSVVFVNYTNYIIYQLIVSILLQTSSKREI